MRKLIMCAMIAVGSLSVKAQTRKITNPTKANGVASYYHDKFEGRQTSTGEIFDNDRFTAASNTLKLNEYAKVTNLTNGQVIYVRINDRMNKTNQRLIDMTSLAARTLNFHKDGLAKVKVERVSEAEGRRAILAQNARAGIRTNRL